MMARVAAIGAVLAATAGLVLSAGNQEEPAAKQEQATTQPAASQPTTSPRAMRPPAQAEIIENLLRDGSRPTLILPQDSQAIIGDGVTSSRPATEPDGPALLVEGTMLVERPGRLVWEQDKAKFAFFAPGQSPGLRTMEILPSQLLEAMEREARVGSSEFVISAEVTRYKDCNYLLLRKILRRVRHGNLSP